MALHKYYSFPFLGESYQVAGWTAARPRPAGGEVVTPVSAAGTRTRRREHEPGTWRTRRSRQQFLRRPSRPVRTSSDN